MNMNEDFDMTITKQDLIDMGYVDEDHLDTAVQQCNVVEMDKTHVGFKVQIASMWQYILDGGPEIVLPTLDDDEHLYEDDGV